MLRDLGPYSDWVDAARSLTPPRTAPPGEDTRARLREVLGFTGGDEQPRGVVEGPTWQRDGVAGQDVSWSVGYGPRTRALLLRPAGEPGPLPGVVALHDHGGFKYDGLAKIADAAQHPPAYLTAYRQVYYEGRAWANELARQGFAVLVHDTFAWGSRRFPLESMPSAIRRLAATRQLWDAPPDQPAEVTEYNAAAGPHELMIEKYCALLGTTLAGVVSREDRVATNYLRNRPDVGRIGCLGLSGGGNRAALLLATHDGIAAAGIVALMTSYDGLLDHNVAGHTWMLFPHGWARHGDWPDVAASRAPLPLLVQYARDDELFTPGGMAAADRALAGHYAAAGAADGYTAQWYDGPHRFDAAMQGAAFEWLRDALASPRQP